jgi:hypothetical protein
MVDGELRDATDEEIAEINARDAGAPIDLESLQASAIARTYTDVDAVYEAAIGRRATEYQKAEEAARAFAAAGYEGEISTYVSGWAQYNPTGQAQSNRWAADQIIARADAFRTAEESMRNIRFQCQAQMRAAEDAEQLAAAVATWDSFIAGTRAALGL